MGNTSVRRIYLAWLAKPASLTRKAGKSRLKRRGFSWCLLPIVELVAIVVGGDDVEQEDVLGLQQGVKHANIAQLKPTLGSSPVSRNFI